MSTDSTNPKDRLGVLKPDLSLLPPAGSIEQSRAQGDGSRKYGAYNWRLKKVRAMIYIAAAQRHLQAYLDGEDYSRDTTYLVLHDDPDRVWQQVECIWLRGDSERDCAHWPTPNSLRGYEEDGTFNPIEVVRLVDQRCVKPGEYTIVQMPVHHLGHMMACAAIVLDARATNCLVDDRPPPGAASDLFARYTLQKPPEVDVLAQTDVEGRKREQASDALDLYLSLLTDAVDAERIQAARAVILNMVNGVFPADEPFVEQHTEDIVSPPLVVRTSDIHRAGTDAFERLMHGGH